MGKVGCTTHRRVRPSAGGDVAGEEVGRSASSRHRPSHCKHSGSQSSPVTDPSFLAMWLVGLTKSALTLLRSFVDVARASAFAVNAFEQLGPQPALSWTTFRLISQPTQEGSTWTWNARTCVAPGKEPARGRTASLRYAPADVNFPLTIKSTLNYYIFSRHARESQGGTICTTRRC